MDYDKTIFKAFEDIDLDRLRTSIRRIVAEDIVSYGTTFYARYETYFKARYFDHTTGYTGISLEDEIYYKVLNGELIDPEDKESLWINILTKHFMNDDSHVNITQDELDSLMNLEFHDSMRTYYLIPLLILCLETAIEKLLK
jgi:hypothetical protein